MSFRVWADEDNSIDLGSPFVVMSVMAKLSEAPDADEYPALMGVVHTDDQDLEKDYVAALRAEAAQYLKAHNVSGDAKRILQALADIEEHARRRSVALEDEEEDDIEAALDYALDLLSYRAEVMAEAETGLMAAEAERIALGRMREDGELPEDSAKMWVSMSDGKVCQVCEELDGQVVGLDELFEGDEGEYDRPPQPHLHCRCRISIVRGEVFARDGGTDATRQTRAWQAWSVHQINDAGDRLPAPREAQGFDPSAHPRDDAGRFTDSGGGGGEGGLSPLVARISAPDGGFTYQPMTGDEPKTGFVLSVYPDRAVVTTAKDLKPEDLAEFVVANKDLLGKADHFLGGWHDPKDGKVYLDVSIVKQEADEARELAKRYNQLAYFDLGTGSSVRPEDTHGAADVVERLVELAWRRSMADQPNLLLLKTATAANVALLYKRLTGREPTPEQMARVQAILEKKVEKHYSEDQPRDDAGRWSGGGGGGGAADKPVAAPAAPVDAKEAKKQERRARDAARKAQWNTAERAARAAALSEGAKKAWATRRQLAEGKVPVAAAPEEPSKWSSKEQQLASETPSSAKDFGGGISQTYRCELADGTRFAFKPNSGEYKEERVRDGVEPGKQGERETAAWEVAKVVGLDDMVPPTVFRKAGVDVEGLAGEAGSAQLWMDGDMAKDKPLSQRYDGDEDLKRAAVFDFATGNTDRHAGNWLMNGDKIVLIDHGYAFSYKDEGQGNHKFVSEVANRAPQYNRGAPPSEYAKVYSDRWPKISTALKGLGMTPQVISRMKKRIDMLQDMKSWEQMERALPGQRPRW